MPWTGREARWMLFPQLPRSARVKTSERASNHRLQGNLVADDPLPDVAIGQGRESEGRPRPACLQAQNRRGILGLPQCKRVRACTRRSGHRGIVGVWIGHLQQSIDTPRTDTRGDASRGHAVRARRVKGASAGSAV